MADETPQQTSPQEEAKRDTVRINLPAGLGGRPGGPTPPAQGNSATTRLKPATPAAPVDEEAKKETSVLGTPIAPPKPKKDTSRVQVAAPKPALPEAPRQAVKFRHDELPGPPPPPHGAPAAAAASAAVGATAPSAVDSGMAVGAIVLSVGVLGYLAYVALM